MMPFDPSNRRFPIAAGLALLLGAAWIFLSPPAPQPSPGGRPPAPQAGFAAPDFTLTAVDGETVTLSDLAGRPVLVNLWASWCVPCRAEMPAMQRTYDRFKAAGFVVLAVNVTSQDSRTAAIAFATEHGLTFPILFDETGEVARLYENRALPSSFFVRPDGIIEEIVIGGPMAEVLIETRVLALFGPEGP
jgi:peroxiredoxin